MLYCYQSTTEKIKEDVAELKEVVKEINQTAKADRSKKFSNIAEMKDQLTEEVSELKQQMFDYLKQMSFRLDSLIAANDTSKTRTKLMDDDELNEYTLDSSQHKVSSSSSNPDDDDDDNKWDD